MILAPRAVEAKILVGERAGDRDLADSRWRIATGWRGLERGERARHLAGLMVDPFRLMLGGIAPARLIDAQNRGIHDAGGQRLPTQRGEARRRFGRDDATAAGQGLEIFENEPPV